MKVSELSGNTYGRLTVIERCENDISSYGTVRSKWLCRCSCGNEVKVIGQHLKNGNTKSCGCLKIDKTIERSYRHGEGKSRLYQIYYAMIGRCKNKNVINYKNYGGRGISVCDEWLGENGFINFREWSLNNGYGPDLSIDRIDVNGNYEPNNCKWSTKYEQMNNTTRSKFVTIGNETRTVAEWSRISGVKSATIYYRLKMASRQKKPFLQNLY